MTLLAIVLTGISSLPMAVSSPVGTKMEMSTSSAPRRVACLSLCPVCLRGADRPEDKPNIAGLVKPIRAVAFSPAGKLLAAAGDSKVIALYDTMSGEQVANISGHSAWILSLAWSSTGEYLLSRYVCFPTHLANAVG
jgi:WD40 repeat protein